MQLFEVKAQYMGVNDNGKEVKVKVTLLVNAASFGDAEAQTYSFLNGHGELSVEAIKRSTINEVMKGEDEFFFLVVTEFITVDERTGKESKTKQEALIAASDTTAAAARLHSAYEHFLTPYEIRKVVFSPISELVNID